MRVDRCPTCRRRLTRSSESNRKYWALLHAMAEKMHPRGQTFSAETFHLWAKSKWLGCIDYVLPSGKTLTVPNSTANLDQEQFGKYLDKVQAFANENGVYLEDEENAA
jgi:hypothetical protein